MRIYKYYCLCAMMMMNCFCGMVDRRKTLSLISSQDHCQRSSPSRISDTRREQDSNIYIYVYIYKYIYIYICGYIYIYR